MRRVLDRAGSGVRTGRLLALGLVAFVVIAASLFVAISLADRRATLEAGWNEAEGGAMLLAQQAGRALRVAELTAARIAPLVDGASLEVLRGPRWTELARIAASTPELQMVWVTDAQGRLVANSLDRQMASTALADNPYTMPLRSREAGDVTGLTQGGPLGGWYFAWCRPLRDEDGGFRGAILAAVPAEAFGQAAASQVGIPSARLRLGRQDGTVVMHWPLPNLDGAVPAAMPLPGPAGMREQLDEEGAPRLVAWRNVPGLPLVASVALSRAAVLAPFQQRLLRNGLVFGAGLLLAGLLAAAAWRAERRGRDAFRTAEARNEALAAALAEREELLLSAQEDEARLRLAEQAGRIGLWDWDLRDGRLTLVGDVFAEWGLRYRRRLTARAALRGVLAEDRLGLAAALTAAVRGEAPLEAEFRLAHSRTERWIGVRAAVRRGVDGQPRRMLGIALDVTERRHKARALAEANASLARRVAEHTGALADANARLREGEARFRGIFDATFQFIGLLSPDGTLLEANEAMLKLGGVTAEKVIGRPYWDAPWWPEDPAMRAAVREAVAQAAAGHFVRRELMMRAQDGGSLAIDFSVKPVRDEDGLVSLLVPEARDVSALKAAQAQLLEAQKMEVLGRLTGGVAHDFNNLLMTVLGNLSLARKRLGDAATPQILRHLDSAALGAERGAQLTQRLLAFARRQDLNPCAVDLGQLLAGLGELLSRSAGQRAQVVVQTPPGLPPALVDPHALELALMNLVVNARDAMPDGGRITVQLDAREAPGEDQAPSGLAPARYLRISVIDTGTGMDAETLARAIEPFFSTKGPGRGTGLGLSMVHGLAHQSGGALQIESAPGRGTAATLWLPVSAQAPAEAAAGEAEAPRGSGLVLLVDDEPMVLESTAALITDLGYEVTVVESAEAALAALAAGLAPRLVITDHAMPGMTGAELVALLARERPDLPVMLATGHAGPWPEGDGTPRLTKPFTQSQIGRALAAILEN